LAQVLDYKRLENNFVRVFKNHFYTFANGFLSFVSVLTRLMKRQYTLVFVPHSEKKVYNLQVTFFSLLCGAIILAGITGVVVWCGNSYNESKNILADRNSKLKEAEANLDMLRDEVGALSKEAKNFRNTLAGVLSILGIKTAADSSKTVHGGDLSSFFDVRESAGGRLREAEEIKSLVSYLARTREPLENLGKLLESQSSLLTEIPNVWPVKGGMGHISQFFGENPDPFTGQLYIHRGVDISTFRYNDPIVATADGQVVTVDYDSNGFGNYVIIRHKHGFYTRYGHMQSFKVRTGQRVQQGEVIGYIGNTGRSTGPHVHYEVHIGSDVVDPYKFLNVRAAPVANF